MNVCDWSTGKRSSNTGNSECPCSTGSRQRPPSAVCNDYFCEPGNSGYGNNNAFYFNEFEAISLSIFCLVLLFITCVELLDKKLIMMSVTLRCKKKQN